MGVTCCENIDSNKRKMKYIADDNSLNIDFNKTYTKKELDKILYQFIDQTIENDKFYDKNDGDEIFNIQKQYEKEKLNNFFEKSKDKINEQIQSALDSSENDSLNNDSQINQLISDVINLENGKKLYSEKIEKIIKDFSHKSSKCINIIVIGRHGIGKKTLINKIFKMKNININMNMLPNNEKEIEEFKSKELPFFRFILLKFNNNFPFDLNDAKTKLMNYINKQYETKNTNKYINCIWYCFNNGSMYNEEIELINSLNNIYNQAIPIIFVHTMSINMMQVNLIRNLNINKDDVVLVLSEDFIYQFNGMYFKSFGIDILITKTLNLYNNNSIPWEDIKSDILNVIRTNNDNACKSAYKEIIQNFINEFKYPKYNVDFIQYLVEIFSLNLKYFLAKVMNYETMNRINSDYNLMQPIKQFIQFYEKNSILLIEPVVMSYSINFIENQKEIQEKKKKNIKDKNKRTVENIQQNVKKYLIDNYTYIFQKHYVYHIFFKKFDFFCEDFKKAFCDLSEQIILNTNINSIQFQEFEKEVKNFFGLNNNFNNNFNNNNIINNIMNNFENNINENIPEELNDSMMSNTIIDNNNCNTNNIKNNININNNMNIINNNNNFFMINNNFNNINNFNNMNNFNNNLNNFNNNNMNFVNNNNFNFASAFNLPSRTEVEGNFNTNMG